MGLISLLRKSKPQRSFKQTISEIIGYNPKKIYLFDRVFTHRSLEKVDDDGKKLITNVWSFLEMRFWEQSLEIIYLQNA